MSVNLFFFLHFTLNYVLAELGVMAPKMITIKNKISFDIDNYYDKCQIFISFKFQGRIFSESCRNQTFNCGFKLLSYYQNVTNI